jgi:hypothetical protein
MTLINTHTRTARNPQPLGLLSLVVLCLSLMTLLTFNLDRASEPPTHTQRIQGDSGGQTASSGNPEDPFGRAVREALQKQYQQKYGDTAEAIRRNLSMQGPTADFVGYDAQGGHWLIAEFKDGTDLYKAWRQLENTTQAFVKLHPTAKVELRLVLDAKHFAVLKDGGRFFNFGMENGVLGWYDDTGHFVEGLIEGMKVLVQAAP